MSLAFSDYINNTEGEDRKIKRKKFPKSFHSNHKNTQKFKEGMKMDKQQIQSILDQIHTTAMDSCDDEDAEISDFNPIPPPLSTGKANANKEGENEDEYKGEYKGEYEGEYKGEYEGEYKGEYEGENKNIPSASTSAIARNNQFKENFASIGSLSDDQMIADDIYKRSIPNYMQTRENSKEQFASLNRMSNTSSNDVLLNKINYMIQLLEDQHDEKTNNVTEEVVLYSFLGVFMIFIADSFVKIGKYVR